MKYLLLLFFVAGCTHNVDLGGFDYGTSRPMTFKGKKVAVVIPDGAVQDNHKTTTEVDTYHFKNTTNALNHALRMKLGAQSKEFKVIQGDEAGGEFDYYLYPQLQSRSVNDFWTHGCLIKYRLTIKDKKKNIVADEKGEGKRNFFAPSQASGKCSLAMSEIFEKVTNRAASQIRQ